MLQWGSGSVWSMGNKLIAVIAATLLGCAGDPPSCQQAVTHYYDAGCNLVNLQTGVAYSVAEVIANCKDLRAAAPDSCIDDMDNLQTCFGSVPSPARTNADCDCSAEQDAILTCE